MGRFALPALYTLLLGVAAAAAVLSFTTLRDLALLCGFSTSTAWLLPLVIDAGAAAGTLAWLSRTGPARTFGSALALVLLGLSVAGNALGHGLVAAEARPHWLVVVAVSAVAPAVLGAVVHLAMLAGPQVADAHTEPAAPLAPDAQPRAELVADAPTGLRPVPPAGDDRAAVLIAGGAGRRKLSRELGISEHEARVLLEEHRGQVPA